MTPAGHPRDPALNSVENEDFAADAITRRQAMQRLGLLGAGAWADRWRRGNVRGYIYVCVIGVCLAVPGVALS